MGRQMAAVTVALARLAARPALDDRLGLFLSGVEHALGDLHVFQRQVVLLRAQFFRFRAELLALQVADNALQPAPRLLRLGQRRLMFGQGGLRLLQERL